MGQQPDFRFSGYVQLTSGTDHRLTLGFLDEQAAERYAAALRADPQKPAHGATPKAKDRTVTIRLSDGFQSSSMTMHYLTLIFSSETSTTKWSNYLRMFRASGQVNSNALRLRISSRSDTPSASRIAGPEVSKQDRSGKGRDSDATTATRKDAKTENKPNPTADDARWKARMNLKSETLGVHIGELKATAGNAVKGVLGGAARFVEKATDVAGSEKKRGKNAGSSGGNR